MRGNGDGGARIERLDNGLRVLLQPLHTAPLVSVWCWYHVGSKNERPGLTGISHFVEHMNFKGTRGISREELKVWIERAGGSWNGYTWVDQTTYFETLAADALDLALRIESERMTDCVYDAEEFESERTVVLAELQGKRNNPEHLLDVDVTAAALRAHPYRWPVIGWASDVGSMTREDLLDHYRRYYVPSNATLVVVGDVDADEALEAVRRRFGDIPPGDPPERRPVREPEPDGERRVVVERPGSTSYLQVVHPAPAFSDPDFVPLLVADAILSGGKGVNLWSGGWGHNARTTSPLYRELVDRELVSVVSSALLPTEEPYLYQMAATLRDGVDHRRAETVLAETLAALVEEPPGERQLQKAKNQILSQIAFQAEGVSQIAHQLGFFATIADLDALAAVPDRVREVSAAEVQEAAGRYLAPAGRTVGWFVPTGEDR